MSGNTGRWSSVRRRVSDIGTLITFLQIGWPLVAGPVSAFLAFTTGDTLWLWLLALSVGWLFGAGFLFWARSRSFVRRETAGPAEDIRFKSHPVGNPPPWGGASRLSLEVHNEGEGADFEAGVLSSVKGLPADPQYGNFYLQWDLQSAYLKHIPKGRSAILRVAYAHDGEIRFLGPETIYGSLTLYKSLHPPGPILADIEVRQSRTDRFAIAKVEIGFNEDGEPYLHVVDTNPRGVAIT